MDKKKISGSIIYIAIPVMMFLMFLGLSGKLGELNDTSVMAAASGSAITISPIAGTTTGSAISGVPTSAISPTAGGKITATPSVSPTVTPTVTPTAEPTAEPTETPTPVPDEPSEGAKITFISANYTGGTVIVGEEFDQSLLMVYAYYDDGFSGPVTDYELAGKLVEKEGSNIFVVLYEGFTANFNIMGKSVKSISAVSSRRNITVGNGIDERDLTVTIAFSNGTMTELKKDYTISPTVFNETGKQKVTITYRNVSTEVTVYVQEAKEVKSLSIAYDTEKGAYTKMAIDRSLITVTAVYTDNSTERITTYKLSPESFSASGKQNLTATYKGQSASVSLNVLELALVSLRAEYKGKDVYVGMEYDPRDLHVYAKYNSDLEEETDEYKVYEKVIKYIGTNTIRIFLGDLKTTVVINGKEMAEPDFDYVSTAEVTSNGYDLSIDTAILPVMEEDAVMLKSISKSKLKHLYRRLKTTTKTYLGFKYGFEDDNDERFLPLTVRITLPDGFKPEYTELYYSPNNKTILGCMNKMGVDEQTIEVTIFNVGTYMLVYDPDAYYEETVAETTEE